MLVVGAIAVQFVVVKTLQPYTRTALVLVTYALEVQVFSISFIYRLTTESLSASVGIEGQCLRGLSRYRSTQHISKQPKRKTGNQFIYLAVKLGISLRRINTASCYLTHTQKKIRYADNAWLPIIFFRGGGGDETLDTAWLLRKRFCLGNIGNICDVIPALSRAKE